MSQTAYHGEYKLSGFELAGEWMVAAIRNGRVHTVKSAPSFEEAAEKLRQWIDEKTRR